jgi:transcriptional repressor NrdR
MKKRMQFMKCPICGYFDSKVIDSRPSQDGNSIRRRRECLECGRRFTTFETVEANQIFVTKKDGEKEIFDRNKLLSGVIKACHKRPVNAELIVAEVEQELHNQMRTDITSTEIGELVMLKLKEHDQVAYVRFASVYREFKDVDTFLKEIKDLMKKGK